MRQWIPAVMLLVAGGCADEMNTSDPRGGDEPVVISASTVSAGIATRANEGWVGKPETIKSRKLLFTYPAAKQDGKMASAVCVFDDSGVGYVYTNEELKEQLLWKDIHVDEETKVVKAVYLDNLLNYPVQDAVKNENPGGGREYSQSDNFTFMYFGPQSPPVTGDAFDNKYKRMIAAEGTPEAEEVDIIWGMLTDVVYGQTLAFSLTHKMAAISFRFYSEIDELQEALQGEDIKVWLDYLRIWMETSEKQTNIFNRSTGQIYHGFFGGQPNNPADLKEKGVYLVKDDKLKPDGENMHFSTPVWILPPFYGALNKPVLSIDFGEKGVYSGHLPENMNYWTYNNSLNRWELMEDQTVSFHVGYQLTFNVRLVNELEDLSIQFVNVLVSAMGTRLTENPTLNEGGINSWEDLMALEALYNEDSSQTNYRLYKFGTWSSHHWKFRLWRDITMPAGTALPQFGDCYFELDFNGHTIEVGEWQIEKSDLVAKNIETV